MGVVQLFSPQDVLNKLIGQTITLAKSSNQVVTIKEFLRCYDILELTNEINKPWETPGHLFGDLGAFIELEHLCRCIIFRKDPDPKVISKYIMDVTRFLVYWKRGMENRLLLKKVSLS